MRDPTTEPDAQCRETLYLLSDWDERLQHIIEYQLHNFAYRDKKIECLQ